MYAIHFCFALNSLNFSSVAMALLFAMKQSISLQDAVAIFEEAGQRNVSPNAGFQQKLCEFERRELKCDNTIKTWSGAADIDGNLYGRRGVTNRRRSQGIFSSSAAASSVAHDLSVFGESTLPGAAALDSVKSPTTLSVLDSVVAPVTASVLKAVQLDAAAARAQLELQHEAIALERQALLQAQAAKRARHVAEAASAAVIMIFCKYPAFCA